VELPAPVRAVDLALSTIAPYGRPDLEARLRQTRARLLDDCIRVLVVGEFKQGKSMLVNALVSAPVCPVYDDVATAVPTVVQFAAEPVLTVVRQHDGADGPVEAADHGGGVFVGPGAEGVLALLGEESAYLFELFGDAAVVGCRPRGVSVGERYHVRASA